MHDTVCQELNIVIKAVMSTEQVEENPVSTGGKTLPAI